MGLALMGCGDDDGEDNKPEPDEEKNTAPAISDQTFSVAEDAANGTAVGTVKATDADKDDLTFSITSGNMGDVFAIEGTTGKLATAGALDYETTQSYTLTVSVSDGELSNKANITVNVTDVADTGFALHADNTDVTGLWSDGTTMWVTDSYDDNIYAYELATGVRQESKEFRLEGPDHFDAGDIWSDETTIWIENYDDRMVYAYELATGTRQESKEFDLHPDNEDLSGIWSDGTTMWVTDWEDNKVYAYNLADGMRQESKEFDMHENNTVPIGLWSDGTTMWVTDSGIYDEENEQFTKVPKIYAYSLPK
ncbi:MAG: cadherin repeat domain-containing protein [Ekhidna sp.]|nr:cadherin repeat domain-containing protein [Ekhidna sp.]